MEEKTGGDRWKAFTEEIEVAGSNLVERVKELLAKGKVRRIRVKGPEGGIFLEIPLNVGAIAGGAVTLAAPWLAILGAFAALIARARIEIVRDVPDETPDKPATGA